MALQFILNIVIAFVWMLLNSNSDFSTFIIGYLVGLLFVFGLRRFFHQEFYFKKVWAIWKLIVLFLKELVLSNLAVVKHILQPQLNIRPGIFALPTELKSNFEITLLACLITLTPGTLTLEVSPDRKTLYIHAMDIHDAELLSDQIKGTFEKAIMEVMR
jgi:multicomponent Na+:H+ antiporter subunit E